MKELKMKRRLNRIFETISDSAPIGIFIVQNGKFQFTNPQFQIHTGYRQDELIGQDSMILVVPEDRDTVVEKAVAMLKEKHISSYEYRVKTKSGKVNWVLGTVAPIMYDGKRAALGYYMDITERKRAEEQLKYLSLHDPLTGLYNRAYFEEEMRRLEGDRYAPVGAIVCDIDGLKTINDTTGHDAGDTLIIAAADLIKKAFRSGDMVARIGGDEFAILLPRVENNTVYNACQRIKESIALYNEENSTAQLNISIGYAVSGKDYVNINGLFRIADSNMYKQKLNNKRSVRSDAIQALMKTLEVRDFITEGHAERMQDLVVNTASSLGLPENTKNDLVLLAQFHDIGKVGVPDSILFKPGPLTSEEITVMRRHCKNGYDIAVSASVLTPIAKLILMHHEWWNGEGYPFGLKGEEIPLECRILAIADAYDAMTSNRPYRNSLSHEEAVTELYRCAGTQFDPNLVDKFVESLQNQPIMEAL